MENTVETKGYYEYRTTLRAMSDGVSLFTKNATMLLKATWPLLLIVSLLGAMFTVSFTTTTGDLLLGKMLDWGDIAKIGVQALITGLAFLVFYAMVFTLFSRYVEKGFMPMITRSTFQPCPKNTKLVRFLLGALWMAFVLVVYYALSFALISLSKWVSVVLVPVYLFLLFWLTNQLVGYVLISDTLMGSIRHSFGITVKGFGSFLTLVIVLSLILGLIACICILPTISSEIIYLRSQLSLAEGDNGMLPGYFMLVFFLASTLSTFLMLILSALEISCWCMVYGAVDTRIRIKKAEKQSIVEIPGNA